MDLLRRLDAWAERRSPSSGSRSSFLTVALVFMVVGVVGLVIGGSTWHSVGIGASGAAIGSMINALRHERQADQRDPVPASSEPDGDVSARDSTMTDLSSAVLRGDRTSRDT